MTSRAGTPSRGATAEFEGRKLGLREAIASKCHTICLKPDAA